MSKNIIGVDRVHLLGDDLDTVINKDDIELKGSQIHYQKTQYDIVGTE